MEATDGAEEIALYSSLWQSCDELRGGMNAAQYKDDVLTLLFMKYVSDKTAAVDPPQAARDAQLGAGQSLAGRVLILSVGGRVLRWC